MSRITEFSVGAKFEPEYTPADPSKLSHEGLTGGAAPAALDSASAAETAPRPSPVTLIAIGRFHHFHLARQLERRGLLGDIWSGYPSFKLKDEIGIAPKKIHAYPWFHVPAPFFPRLPVIGRSLRLAREFRWAAFEAIDKRVERTLKNPGVLVGLSSGGLHSGRRMRELGGYYICDRASSHIRFQDESLHEEYRRWNMEFEGVDPRVVEKEEAEYEAADVVTLPSDFCYRSFVAKGVRSSPRPIQARTTFSRTNARALSFPSVRPPLCSRAWRRSFKTPLGPLGCASRPACGSSRSAAMIDMERSLPTC